MAVHGVRCPCLGNPECKLCHGGKVYEYDVGPRGWMPFTCPTCGGAKTLPATDGGEPRVCVTCNGAGNIDPAFPPPANTTGGFLRKCWKIFMGG